MRAYKFCLLMSCRLNLNWLLHIDNVHIVSAHIYDFRSGMLAVLYWTGYLNFKLSRLYSWWTIGLILKNSLTYVIAHEYVCAIRLQTCILAVFTPAHVLPMRWCVEVCIYLFIYLFIYFAKQGTRHPAALKVILYSSWILYQGHNLMNCF